MGERPVGDGSPPAADAVRLRALRLLDQAEALDDDSSLPALDELRWAVVKAVASPEAEQSLS